jgi:transposase
LRWHLHELDPIFLVPLRRLDRASQLERVGHWLARRQQDVQVRIARERVNHCRSLTRTIDELNEELEQRADAVAPALLELPCCGAITAAKLLAEIGPISRFQKRRTTCPPQRRRAAASKLRQ